MKITVYPDPLHGMRSNYQSNNCTFTDLLHGTWKAQLAVTIKIIEHIMKSRRDEWSLKI